MDGRARIKNRIFAGVWLLILTVMFFYRGYPAVTAMLVFTLAYIAFALVYVRAAGKKLSIRVTGGDMVDKGSPMEIKVNIANDGLLPVFCCTCEVESENMLTGTSRFRDMQVSIPPRSKSEKDLKVSDDCCGKIRVGIRKRVIEDPLRLFAAEKNPADETESKEKASLKKQEDAIGYVLPRLHGAAIPPDWLDSYNMESYRYSQTEKGNDPGEVFGVREYIEGDSPKQIHWKLTAKLGDMTVKIPSLPIENNIMLLMDSLPEPGTGMDPKKKSDLIENFCSLSSTLADNGIPHNIGWYDMYGEMFCNRNVRTAEDLVYIMPDILGCGIAESDVSAVHRYIESGESAGYTNYFLVTDRGGRDVDRLENMGAVRVFRTEE